ncbi:hypothetical protein NKG05_29815 [Oerskovia sp. M15]
MIYEQLTAVRLPDAERTRELRRRYVEVHLAACDPRLTCTAVCPASRRRGRARGAVGAAGR